MNDSSFKNETAFPVFYGRYYCTTRNGWDGTNFHNWNLMVDSVQMLGDGLVNIIVPYEMKVYTYVFVFV